MNNSVTVDFSVLGLLPKMAEQMEKMQNKILDLEQQLNPKYDLTTRAGIRNYLEITDSTISLYLKNGTFREGYHFFKKLKGSQSKITFVSGAIEEFKKSKER